MSDGAQTASLLFNVKVEPYCQVLSNYDPFSSEVAMNLNIELPITVEQQFSLAPFQEVLDWSDYEDVCEL